MPAEEAGAFFDTNVLLYLISMDEAKARQVDVRLLKGGTISVQILNEFTNVARRKFGLEVGRIRPFLLGLRDLLNVMPMTLQIHDAGLQLIERYRFSTYDALIVAAALEAGCELLLSEDMHDGLIVEGRLRIENPFRAL